MESIYSLGLLILFIIWDNVYIKLLNENTT